MPTQEYRVVLWEQPVMDGVEPASIGWGERTVDLVEAADLFEVIEWAEQRLANNEGPYSAKGTPVRDREFVIYARVPGGDLYLQVVGRDPTRHPDVGNLRRRRATN